MSDFEEKDQKLVNFPEGLHPVELYYKGDMETRGDVLLNHPEVTGFIYLHEDVITKAYFPKKVVNFKATSEDNKKVIAAVSGSTDEFTPFCVPEKILLCDALHFTDYNQFAKGTTSVSVGKFLKENKKDLPSPPQEFSSDAKTKNVRIISFPMILPIVKGFKFEEGPIEEDKVFSACEEVNDFYADWVFLQSKKYTVQQAFLEEKIPIPETTCGTMPSLEDLPLKVLFKSKYVLNGPYSIIKKAIDNFVEKNNKVKVTEKTSSIPDEVDISETKSSTSSSHSEGTKTVEKNERLIAFLSIFFARPYYDRNGELSSLLPADITDEAMELLSSSSSTSEQARTFSDGIEVLADDISREKSYLSRASKFPFLSQTLITYAIQAHYHTGAIDKSIDSLKKSFNVLALLAPPTNSDDDYSGYVNSSKNVEVDRILDQPTEKRSSIRKEIFIKGKQDVLEDVTAFIANIIVFARYWVKIEDDEKSQPLVIQMISEVADFLSSSEYKSFHERFKNKKVFMPHTLIAFIFNIVSIFVKMAKNPHVSRKFKVENFIDPKEIRIAIIMHKSLIDQLQLCSATSSIQNLFAQPPSSFKLFCPAMNKVHETMSQGGQQDKFPRQEKRVYSEDKFPRQDYDPRKRPTPMIGDKKGSITNTTGKKFWFPRGLEKKYCSDFLDDGATCRHAEKCIFVHAIFPSGFAKNDVPIMEEHIKNTPGISLNKKNVSRE